jgi:hypothetical protein
MIQSSAADPKQLVCDSTGFAIASAKANSSSPGLLALPTWLIFLPRIYPPSNFNSCVSSSSVTSSLAPRHPQPDLTLFHTFCFMHRTTTIFERVCCFLPTDLRLFEHLRVLLFCHTDNQRRFKLRSPTLLLCKYTIMIDCTYCSLIY